VTAARMVRLWCDGLDDPADGQRFGASCHADFEPDPPQFISQISVMRKEAAKAGWKHVRNPVSARLDTDLCPAHNPDRKPEADQ
jgi:hypothetical protein